MNPYTHYTTPEEGEGRGSWGKMAPAWKRLVLLQVLAHLGSQVIGTKKCKVAYTIVAKATRTDSDQKICGGVWQGFDHLTKLESLKCEVVLQGGLRSFVITRVKMKEDRES